MSCGSTLSPLTNGKDIFLEGKKTQYMWNMFEGCQAIKIFQVITACKLPQTTL